MRDIKRGRESERYKERVGGRESVREREGGRVRDIKRGRESERYKEREGGRESVREREGEKE